MVGNFGRGLDSSQPGSRICRSMQKVMPCNCSDSIGPHFSKRFGEIDGQIQQFLIVDI